MSIAQKVLGMIEKKLKFKVGDKVQYKDRDSKKWLPAVIIEIGKKYRHAVVSVETVVGGRKEDRWGYMGQIRKVG